MQLKVSTAEETVNNQVDQMAYAVDVSRPLSQPPQSLFNGPVNNVAMVVGMHAMQVLNRLDFSFQGSRPSA